MPGKGYHNSGDYLNINTRCLLAGIPRAVKIIDDGLLQPGNATQAYKEPSMVMTEAIRKSFKFSEEKFNISTQVLFAGLDITTNASGRVTICPDKTRIEGLHQLQAPRSRKETHSLQQCGGKTYKR